MSTKGGAIKAVSLCGIVMLLVACSGSHYVPVYNARYDVKPQQLTYRVKKQDTLFSIAWRYQIDYKELARLNGLKQPFRIYPGQVLTLQFGNTSGVNETKYNNKNTAKNSKSKYDGVVSNIRSGSLNRAAKSRVGAVSKWVWPADGKVVPKSLPGKAGRKGLDIFGNHGEPVRAAASGKVVYSGGGLLGYGNLIIIEHNEELLSAYAHNSQLLSREGDHVKVGQKVAEIGASGTRKSKLYFEIRRKGVPVDPVKYLPKK